MKVERITVAEIQDSRGAPTIAVSLIADHGSGTASIPSGTSTGSLEAAALAPAEAARAASEITAAAIGRVFQTNQEFDRFLTTLDGTPRRERLGGNVLLGASLAFARARAAAAGKELWEVLRAEYFPNLTGAPAPRIFANFIEGGMHAGSGLSLQEYLVVAKPYPSIGECVAGLRELYAMIGKALAGRGGGGEITTGYEGGYAAKFRDDREPLELLAGILRAARRDEVWFLGVDAAAATFAARGGYRFGGEQLTPAALSERYASYAATVPLLRTIEDPFGEDAMEDFAAFQKRFPDLMVIGDDLTVTNAERIEACANLSALRGVIVKPNQAGTVTETCAAMSAAAERGLAVIVSHRAGETPDPFLVHFARAGNAYGVKIGAPVTHRLPRYDELMRLYPEVV